MATTLRPHPFAALFPALPPAELEQLARDIKERGQLEPIVLHQGRILDGRNRYKACQIAGVKPRIEEFDAKTSRRKPEEFILSRNLRRRHLSVGQKAAIALDWSEQIDPEPEKTKALGRPKGNLGRAAKYIGINEQRVFEVRQIRDANRRLYRDVKAGKRSLNGALAEISPARENVFHGSVWKSGQLTFQESVHGLHQEMREQAQSTGGKVTRAAEKPACKASVKPPPSCATVEKALARIKRILGSWSYAEVKSRNLIQNPEEIVKFAKLSDPHMLEISPLLRSGWTFAAAFREIVERLTPDDQIRALHTRAVASGEKWYLSSIGNFGHLVVWGAEKDKIVAKLRDTLERPSTLSRS